MVEALGSDPIDEGIGRVNVCSPFGLQSLQVPSALAAAECVRTRSHARSGLKQREGCRGQNSRRSRDSTRSAQRRDERVRRLLFVISSVPANTQRDQWLYRAPSQL
jgi:hypothetical protein